MMDADRTARDAGLDTRKARDAVGERVEDARETLKDAAGKAMGAAQAIYGRAAGRAQGLAGDVDTMIDDQPYVALAVAAVGGLAVGLILGLSLGGRD